MENISVKIDGKKVVCEKGITYFELAKQTGHSDALVVKVDGVVKELGKTVESGKKRFAGGEIAGKKLGIKINKQCGYKV